MSELSDKKPAVTESLGGTAELGAQMQAKGKPVQIWAAFGGAILALQLYVWAKWITGPYFEHAAGVRASGDDRRPSGLEPRGGIGGGGHQLRLVAGVLRAGHGLGTTFVPAITGFGASARTT